MTDHPGAGEPPIDAPVISGASPEWGGMLTALTGLVLVAVAAFSLIGTEPQPAPVGVTIPTVGPGDAGGAPHTARARVPTLGD